MAGTDLVVVDLAEEGTGLVELGVGIGLVVVE